MSLRNRSIVLLGNILDLADAEALLQTMLDAVEGTEVHFEIQTIANQVDADEEEGDDDSTAEERLSP